MVGSASGAATPIVSNSNIRRPPVWRAPEAKIAESDPKDKLVAMMKDSFAFCSTALANVDDSKLGEQLMLFGNRPISRGGALVALGGSWTDHYATEAIYLRLNGILPPTAQPPKQ